LQSDKSRRDQPSPVLLCRTRKSLKSSRTV